MLIQFSWLLWHCGREFSLGRRQFHAGEEGQGGNFGTSDKSRATGSRGSSPTGLSFQLMHRTILPRIDLLLIQLTVRDRVTSWKNIRGSRVVK